MLGRDLDVEKEEVGAVEEKMDESRRGWMKDRIGVDMEEGDIED